MKIIRLALILLILSASGTTGYMLIEGWNFLDAFYMTVITLTTTGFQEVHHLSESGKIFTTAFLMTGFALFTYILSSTIQEIVDLKLSH